MPETPIDPTRCPLCGAPNACAEEIRRQTGQGPAVCWCQTMDFPEALRTHLMHEWDHRACICARCAAQVAEEHTPSPSH